MTNTNVAQQLQKQARKLAEKNGNLYRIRAYRRAALAILGLSRFAGEMEKCELETLPDIGAHLALAITHYTQTGDWKTYEELTTGNLAV